MQKLDIGSEGKYCTLYINPPVFTYYRVDRGEEKKICKT